MHDVVAPPAEDQKKTYRKSSTMIRNANYRGDVGTVKLLAIALSRLDRSTQSMTCTVSVRDCWSDMGCGRTPRMYERVAELARRAVSDTVRLTTGSPEEITGIDRAQPFFTTEYHQRRGAITFKFDAIWRPHIHPDGQTEHYVDIPLHVARRQKSGISIRMAELLYSYRTYPSGSFTVSIDRLMRATGAEHSATYCMPKKFRAALLAPLQADMCAERDGLQFEYELLLGGRGGRRCSGIRFFLETLDKRRSSERSAAASALLEHWNAVHPRKPAANLKVTLSQITKMLAEESYFDQNWRSMVNAVSWIPGLSGRNKSEFYASIDWFLSHWSEVANQTEALEHRKPGITSRPRQEPQPAPRKPDPRPQEHHDPSAALSQWWVSIGEEAQKDLLRQGKKNGDSILKHLLREVDEDDPAELENKTLTLLQLKESFGGLLT